ncbi:MAG TPA: thioredoxin [Opitutaceae bacterium]
MNTLPHLPAVTTDSFQHDVVNASYQQPVIVDFWAAWCGPCRMMAPSLNEIATEREGRAVVAKVDVDANPELAAEYNIRAIPALYIFSNGKVVDTVVGVRAKSDLLQHLDTAIANHAATLA